ncbi:MAG TPA: tetratricopeptide repeat protein, partial [Telluria sp.]|nr:tetratricopeptide repeat protein [Telluria sp.]
LAPLDGPEDLAKPEDFAPVPPEVTPSAEAPVPAWSLTELPQVEAAAHPTPLPGAAVPPPPAPDSAEDVQRAAARAQRAHPNTWEPETPPSEPALTQRTRHAPPPPHRPASEPAPAAARVPDARTIRLVVLFGILLTIVALFGYLYWRAVYGPGSSRSLPAVPMPGLAASTQPADGAVTGTVVPGGGSVTGLSVPGNEMAPVTGIQPAPVAAAPRHAAPEPAPPITAPLPSALGSPTPPVATASPPPAAPVAAAPVRPAARPVLAAPAPSPASAIVTNVPRPTPEQMKNLSPEDYSRIDRQAVAEDEAAKAAQQLALQQNLPSAAVAPAAGTVALPVAAPPPTAVGAGADVQVTHAVRPAQVNPAVLAGYTALKQGDFATARQQYQSVLAAEPANRDAQLGMAALAAREQQPGRAAELYGRLLEQNPDDPDALAGLAALRLNDPGVAEQRLRRSVARHPEGASALFSLGNLYAREGRWREAQDAYFRAFTAAPDIPDYAFNLAVGLDRVGQPRLARGYYQRALDLAGAHAASFDTNACANRIRELGGP